MLNNFINPAISMPGGWEWILIVGLALLLFGGRRLPQLAKDLGSGIREFKNAVTGKNEDLDLEDEKKDEINEKRGKK